MGRASIHPIEEQSYTLLRQRVDLSDLPPLSRAVAERIVHTTAEPAWAGDLVLDEVALRRGWRALADGAPVVVDARMVAAGITRRSCEVPLGWPGVADDAASWELTRSAAAMRRAAAEVGPHAVWVVGNAPTALAELLTADVAPALVVGLPVGFVGAVAAKSALRASGLPAVSNRSERGGAAAAAAALNALLYMDRVGDTGAIDAPAADGSSS